MNYRKMHYGSDRPRKPGQRKRIKTPPEPAKPSVVRFVPLNKLLDWDEHNKMLVIHESAHHVFPAKNKAQSAVWYTVQKLEGAGDYKDYQVEDA